MKMVGIFAHYDPQDTIKDYVIHYLEKLRCYCHKIIFVSTSSLTEVEISKINGLTDLIICRENIGHDFYSYKIGIEALKTEDDLDQIIICNDSCFGPLFDLGMLFDNQELISADFWGISENYRPKLHLQSYFLVFGQKVIYSDHFKRFWQELAILTDKDSIISNYEVGLSQCLLAAGFKAKSWLSLQNYNLDFVQFFQRKLAIYIRQFRQTNNRYSWKSIFETLKRTDKSISLYDYSIIYYHMPFLKKSLFKDNWINKKNVYKLIEKYTEYDLNLIKSAVDG